MDPVFFDRVSGGILLGDPLCPCGRILAGCQGWPLDLGASYHVCPHCPPGDDSVGCAAATCTRGHTAASGRRFVQQRLPLRHGMPPRRALEHELARRLPPGTYVEVEVWDGCDEDWVHPVYVSAWPTPQQVESPFHDAVCDLGAAPLADQAAFVLTQLLRG